MATIHEVCRYLHEVAPLSLAEDWDNVGLLLGDEATDVARAITCLTLTPDVADEAVAVGARLIVTHHPILFKPVQRLTAATSEGRMLLKLLRHGIAVYSPHTAYDNSATGVNQQLAELLELTDIAPLRPRVSGDHFKLATIDILPMKSFPDGSGRGRFGRLLQPMSLGELNQIVKDRLQQPQIQFVGNPSSKIETLGIACGAAAEFLRDAHRAGCQALLTGEARFHACLEARDLQVALILPGHYATERPAMETLAVRLASQFPGLIATASEKDRDPVSG